MARAKLTSVTWHKGPSYGVVALGRGFVHEVSSKRDTYGFYKNYNTVVTNNGEQWSYFVTLRTPRDVAFHFFDLYSDDITNRGGSVQKLEPSWRLPLEWAKKDIQKRKKAGTLSMDVTYADKALDTLSKEALPLSNGDEATYEGFGAVVKKSAHTLEALHKEIDRSIVLAQKIWKWSPVRPQVKFHDKSNAFGLAYNPGGGVHIISLNGRMLAEYSMDSIFRTIIHEWCHHYRDEKFPRGYDPHDAQFCELLGMVDPLVLENKRACTFFTDIKDVAIASLKAKKSNIKDPIWTPEAGTIIVDHLKSGAFNINWIPNPGFKWGKRSFKLSDPQFLAFAKNFALQDWQHVEVLLTTRGNMYTYERGLKAFDLDYGKYKGKKALVTNLLVLANIFISWLHMTDLRQIIEEVLDAEK